MNELSSKQKRHLRGLGQKLSSAVVVGKAGLFDGLLKQVSELLDQHELVKIRMPAGDPADRKNSAAEIASATGANLITVVGRNALLYRPGDKSDSDKCISTM